jgi:hypothetical protein
MIVDVKKSRPKFLGKLGTSIFVFRQLLFTRVPRLTFCGTGLPIAHALEMRQVQRLGFGA